MAKSVNLGFAVILLCGAAQSQSAGFESFFSRSARATSSPLPVRGFQGRAYIPGNYFYLSQNSVPQESSYAPYLEAARSCPAPPKALLRPDKLVQEWVDAILAAAEENHAPAVVSIADLQARYASLLTEAGGQVALDWFLSSRPEQVTAGALEAAITVVRGRFEPKGVPLSSELLAELGKLGVSGGEGVKIARGDVNVVLPQYVGGGVSFTRSGPQKATILPNLIILPGDPPGVKRSPTWWIYAVETARRFGAQRLSLAVRDYMNSYTKTIEIAGLARAHAYSRNSLEREFFDPAWTPQPPAWMEGPFGSGHLKSLGKPWERNDFVIKFSEPALLPGPGCFRILATNCGQAYMVDNSTGRPVRIGWVNHQTGFAPALMLGPARWFSITSGGEVIPGLHRVGEAEEFHGQGVGAAYRSTTTMLDQ